MIRCSIRYSGSRVVVVVVDGGCCCCCCGGGGSGIVSVNVDGLEGAACRGCI